MFNTFIRFIDLLNNTHYIMFKIYVFGAGYDILWGANEYQWNCIINK